jgi:cytochrome c oxidase subunit 2
MDTYGQQMAPMAATLVDDNAIANVAAFVKSLPDTPVETKVTGDAARGKAAYAACATCHWRKAEGMQAMDAPRLAGMSDWYLVQQLQNFRSGLRGKHPKDAYGMQMSPMAATLASDQAINDVIAYINSISNTARAAVPGGLCRSAGTLRRCSTRARTHCVRS